MRTKLCSVILTASLLGAAAAASAQDSQDNSYYQPDRPLQQFEITPLAGYRAGGRFDIRGNDQNIDVDSHNALSLALGWRISSTEQYELLYSRQETSLESNQPFGPVDLDIQYLHIGGTVITNDERRVQPYITGGLGITRFSPDAPSVSDEEHFSLNFGGGLRVPVSNHFSLRLEARGYVTFVDTNTAIFCASGSNGGLCNIRGRGNAFFQYDAMLGAAFSF